MVLLHLFKRPSDFFHSEFELHNFLESKIQTKNPDSVLLDAYSDGFTS